MALSTADCRNWLVADVQTQKIVADNSGHTDYLAGREPLADVQMTWVTNAKLPKKWKRVTKFKVGGKFDKENHGWDTNEYAEQQIGKPLAGGVIREFWLEDTDHVTIAILELSGKLYFLDDLSD